MSFLQIAGLSKRFGAVNALAGLDLTVARGTRVAVVGPSGSGKTTLLRLIAGFEIPDSGTIRLDGQLLAEGGRAAPPHRRGIGIVAQDGALFPHLSVGENIGFGLARNDPSRAIRIREMLAMVELEPAMLARRPDQLSGGQQQRVALARAMAAQPRLMLLDEPFSALDTGLRASMREAVSALLGKAAITTILITHDQAEALSFADQVAVMREGRLLQVGTPREVYFQPRGRMVAEFMGDCLILSCRIEDRRARCLLGEVEIAGPAADGPAQIMLRPEQILLSPGSSGVARSPLLARVIAIDFAGRTSTVTVQITAGSRTDTVLLRGVGSRGLQLGAPVAIAIVGPAHVLAP